jgi:hypothetical protein
MTYSTKSFISQHNLASISLAVCLFEVVIIWGGVVVVQISGQHPAIFRFTSAVWLCGGLVSIVSAIAALIVDARREVGVVSLAVAVALFIACGLPMMV